MIRCWTVLNLARKRLVRRIERPGALTCSAACALLGTYWDQMINLHASYEYPLSYSSVQCIDLFRSIKFSQRELQSGVMVVMFRTTSAASVFLEYFGT